MSAGLHGAGPLGEAAERTLVERARSQGMRLIGPESLGRDQHRPRPSSCTPSLSSVDVLPGPGRLPHPVGHARHRRPRARPPGRARHLDVHRRRAPRPTSAATTCCSSGRATRAPTWCCSTSSRSATRGSSPASPVGCRGASRSSRSRRPTGRRARRPSGGLAGDPDWPADATIGALLAQSGVIRVDTPTELFDVARVHRRPAGARRSSHRHRQQLARLEQPDPRRVLRRRARPGRHRRRDPRPPGRGPAAGTRVANPVDLTFAAGPETYELAVGEVLADPGVDAVLVVYAPPANERRREVRRRHRAGRRGRLGGQRRARAGGGDLPRRRHRRPARHRRRCASRCSSSPTARPGRWVAWPTTATGWPSRSASLPDHDPAELDEARALVADILEADPDGTWLDVDAAAALLELCGLPDDAVPPGARRPTRRSRPARRSGDPVVLKATGLERLQQERGRRGVARRPRPRRAAGRLRAHGRAARATPWSRPWCSAWPRRGRRAGRRPPAAVLRRGHQPRARAGRSPRPTRGGRCG